ncbi:MAG: hypothetical protein GWN58_04660, partial [Anaerolineae bacterium]|nr:hypothetical protein [Anaerolineae bacterium]
MSHRLTLFENPVFSSLVFAASLFLTNFLLEQKGLSAPTRLAMAMIPLGTFLYWVWTQAKAYKQADELWQRILLTTWTYALVTSVLGALGLHYVQRA